MEYLSPKEGKETKQKNERKRETSKYIDIKRTNPPTLVDKTKEYIDSHYNWLEGNYQRYRELEGTSAEGFRKEYLQIKNYAHYYRTFIDNNIQKKAFSDFYQDCAQALGERRNKLEGILRNYRVAEKLEVVSNILRITTGEISPWNRPVYIDVIPNKEDLSKLLKKDVNQSLKNECMHYIEYAKKIGEDEWEQNPKDGKLQLQFRDRLAVENIALTYGLAERNGLDGSILATIEQKLNETIQEFTKDDPEFKGIKGDKIFVDSIEVQNTERLNKMLWSQEQATAHAKKWKEFGQKIIDDRAFTYDEIKDLYQHDLYQAAMDYGKGSDTLWASIVDENDPGFGTYMNEPISEPPAIVKGYIKDARERVLRLTKIIGTSEADIASTFKTPQDLYNYYFDNITS